MATNNLLTYAQEYINYGFSIIPIGSDKKPLIPWKEYQTRIATQQEIELWTNNPNITGLAVVTGKISDIFVLDCDDECELGNYPLPSTPTVMSGSGMHHYFQYPRDIEVKNTVNILPHVDIRGEGGYILLPPSKHPSGIEYAWLTELNTPISEAPDWLLELITGTESTPPVIAQPVEIISGVEEGGRNNSATKIIGKLLGVLPEKDWKEFAWPLVKAWNETNRPPLEEKELVTTFSSIANRELIQKSSSQSHSIYKEDQVTNSKEFEIFSLGELIDQNGEGIQWIVDQIIPKQGITCIAGKPKSGKSFLLLEIARSIAEGSELFDHFVSEATGVLLIAKEDNRPLLSERVQSLQLDKSLPIFFSTDQYVYLDTPIYLSYLINYCHKNNIGLVMFDSFRRFMHGEENSSQFVSELHHAFRQLTNEKISVLFVHHLRKDNGSENTGAENLRGSSDIWAMADSVLILELNEDANTLKISQSALRQAKAVSPFVVKNPNFDDGNTRYVYYQNAEPETSKEQAKKDALELIEKAENEIYQKEIIELLLKDNNKPYQATVIKGALKSLVDQKKIRVRLYKGKNYYSLKVEDTNEIKLLPAPTNSPEPMEATEVIL